MRKVILSMLMMLFCAGFMTAKELTSKQRNMRSEIVQFLKTEGYMPEIDSDGDIKFKSEGSSYYVIFDANETSPMYISLASVYGYHDSGKWSREWFIDVAPEINLYKGVALVMFESEVHVCARFFLTNAEQFNRAFYRLMEIIKAAENELSQTD